MKKTKIFKTIGIIAEVVLYMTNLLAGLLGIISLYADWKWKK